MNNDFRSWLLKELDHQGWTQADLAYQSSMSRTAISDVLSGKRSPGIDFCKAIAKALGYSQVEVLRVAGLLDPDPSINPIQETINYRISTLSEEERRVLLEMIEFFESRRNRQEK